MKLKVIQTDITTINVDAIVNAANTSLLGGSGVDGAIHRKGGLQILEECKRVIAKQGKCKVGEAVITTAGNLPAHYVIHTVGPVWNQGGKEKQKLLANCYINAMQLALNNGVTTIAFPNISTGIYRFPKEIAAEIAINAIQQFVTQETIKEVYFVCFDIENFELYTNQLVK
ncbi:O-acetyl-ADP-ribose deacetylase [Aquimarina sp. AU119]|uniref:O-acetyl-ADP-ribose deacetylase n=1 Tax=Aquimarina sp. AU119 TaxID=2108528 RepID=UPI000D6959A7|nr:O-acetyl-ADP-ribose deacetylase [Aquimarina sp. AU119]